MLLTACNLVRSRAGIEEEKECVNESVKPRYRIRLGKSTSSDTQFEVIGTFFESRKVTGK